MEKRTYFYISNVHIVTESKETVYNIHCNPCRVSDWNRTAKLI